MQAYERCVARERAPIPTVCVGSVLVGGSGKTPVTQGIVRFIRALSASMYGRDTGADPHVICRGYGGREVGPLQVDLAAHAAHCVGDEPLIHAASGPTWIARSRLAGVRAAALAGARVAILDDGLQHFRILPDISLLVLRTPCAHALGNGRVLPAGPLREKPAEALRRVDAVVILADTLPSGVDCDAALSQGLSQGPGIAHTHTDSHALISSQGSLHGRVGADTPHAGRPGGGSSGDSSSTGASSDGGRCVRDSRDSASGRGGGFTGSEPTHRQASTPSMATGLHATRYTLPAALSGLMTSASPSADAQALEREVVRLYMQVRADKSSGNGSIGRACGGKESRGVGAAHAELSAAANGGTNAHAGAPAVLHAALLPTEASRAALAGLDVIAFSATATPESFTRVLQQVVGTSVRGGRRGGRVHATYAYPDHAHIEDSELRWLLARAHERGAALVSTSKDRVRLPAWALPHVLELEVCVKWEVKSASRLAALLTERVLGAS